MVNPMQRRRNESVLAKLAPHPSCSIRPRRGIGLLALAIVAFGCSEPSGERVELANGELVLEVELEPGTPQLGTNDLRLALHDRAGSPVDDARIHARIHMPAMGAMAAMGGDVTLVPENGGRHRGSFELDMSGTWQVELEAERNGAPALRAEGTLTVGTPGLRLAVLNASPSSASSPTPGSDRHPAEIVIANERLQRVGVTTTSAVRRTLGSRVRAVGRVVVPDSGQVDVSLKVRGWATAVAADALGVRVERGGVLFEAYSPELLTAQQEYVDALASQARARSTTAPERADALVSAARDRLRRWDVAERDLDRLRDTLEIRENLPIRAPVSGYVVEKSLVQGGAFEPGQRLYRIAPLDPVWIEAQIDEGALARVESATRASVALAHHPSQRFEAHILGAQPVLDPTTRTARIRLSVANDGLALRPDMYADVEFEGPPVERLVVPESAVLQAGARSFVFRALGEGRFRPATVSVGERFGDEVEILEGLAEGDSIVRSGTFLIAAESRLRAALEQW